MVKLSIIVPVYNVERYLDECIQSIISQTLSEYELILVDDGSVDKSGVICDQYQEKYDDLIRVIHKANGGLSSARSAGLAIANGKYIAFIDSDDRISVDSLCAILHWIDSTSADLCFMQAIKFYPDGKKVPLGDNIIRSCLLNRSKSEAIKHLSTRPKFPGSACTKLYKSEFLRKKNIVFPNDKRTSEDLGFVLDCIINADIYDALEIPYYEYRQGRKESITHSNTLKGFWDHALFVNESKEKIGVFSEVNEFYIPLLSFVAYEYVLMIYMYEKLSKAEKKETYGYLKANREIMKYAQTKKLRIINMFLIVFGIRITSKLLSYYMKLR